MNQFYNANFIIFSTIVAINSNEDNAFDDDDDDSEIEINTDNNNYELVNPESEDDENENKNKFSILAPTPLMVKLSNVSKNFVPVLHCLVPTFFVIPVYYLSTTAHFLKQDLNSDNIDRLTAVIFCYFRSRT